MDCRNLKLRYLQNCHAPHRFVIEDTNRQTSLANRARLSRLERSRARSGPSQGITSVKGYMSQAISHTSTPKKSQVTIEANFL